MKHHMILSRIGSRFNKQFKNTTRTRNQNRNPLVEHEPIIITNQSTWTDYYHKPKHMNRLETPTNHSNRLKPKKTTNYQMKQQLKEFYRLEQQGTTRDMSRNFDMKWTWKKKMKSWRKLMWLKTMGVVTPLGWWKAPRWVRLPPLEDSQDPQDKTKRRRASITKKPLQFKRVTSLSISIFNFCLQKQGSSLYRNRGSIMKGKIHEESL